jgi:hypothetical protein
VLPNESLVQLIETCKALAAVHDATADHLVTMAECGGWNDDPTQEVDWSRHQARTSRMLAQEVRDGML